MEGKLIKDKEHYYLKVDNKIFADIDGHPLKAIENKLSLKNCEAVFNGYDLDELACDEIGIDISVIKHIDSKLESHSSPNTPIHEAGAVGAGLYHMVKGFEIGFQKALEILGDKKFSEEDMREAISQTRKGMLYNKKYEDEYIQSLQKTEWDVEVEMKFNHTPKYNRTLKTDFNSHKLESVPKLDADGCLILKRK